MPVRLAVPAMIAADARLDEAGTIRGRQGVLKLARMGRTMRPVCLWLAAGTGFNPVDGVAHEGAERLFVQGRAHAYTSTESTMPMMAASTAAALRPSASPAALPSKTTSTFSPTPAPTESIASIVVPRGFSSSVSG